MDERPAFFRGPDRGRWLVVAVLILVGVGLYFWFAPTNSPAAPPAAETE